MEPKEKNSNNLSIHRSKKHHFTTNKKSHRLRKNFCLVLLIIFLGAFYYSGFYLNNILNSAKLTINKAYTTAGISKHRNVSKILKDKKPISILILGTDTGDLGRSDTGRTDTLIVATINPQTNHTTLTSIPRDLQVKIAGTANQYEKVNAAYTIGGVSTSLKTIQNTLHIPIDYFILVNMGGLTKIVDAVGGVKVKPPLTFAYDAVSVKKDEWTLLDGKQALSYSRMRYDDPDGDYGRQLRQRQIITAIIKKSISVSTLSTYQKLFSTLEKNMKTDLTYDDLLAIATNYKSAGKTIKSHTLQGKEVLIDGSSYQVASIKEKQEISNKIRKELNLKPSDDEFNNEFGATNQKPHFEAANNNYN